MKVVIIGGSGHWGAVAPGVKAHGKARVTAVAPGGTDEKVGHVKEAVEKELGSEAHLYEDWRTMLDAEKPDVAVVNPFFFRNGTISRECLERGVHVYVEKPMATTWVDFRALKAVWERNPATRIIAMQELRYLPEFLAGWKHVKSGAIGKPLLLTAQKSYPLLQRASFFRKRETYGGTIPWIGIHALDWILWYAGEGFSGLSAQHATMGNNGHEELETLCTIQARLKSGALAMANLDYLRSPKAGRWGDDRIRVMGEHGGVEVREGKALCTPMDSEPVELELEPQRLVFQEMLEWIEGKNDSFLLSPEESFYATEVSLWARQAADEGREVQI